MRLSTSTSIHESILWNRELFYTCHDSIEACVKAGFRVLDMNFASYARGPGAPMAGNEWESWLKEQKEFADNLGVEWNQGHAHYNLKNVTHTELISEWDEELVRRSIIGASIMGVKQLVIHPISVNDDVWYSRKKSLAANLEAYARYGELAAKYNVGICLENMFQGQEVRRFASSLEDLLELYERLNDQELFGICWDTGHANLMGIHQASALKSIGKRLKALHINDNRGELDDHIAPYFGTIEWEPIMKTLKEIGYTGDFTFETHNFTKGLPHGLHDQTIRFTYELGAYMLDLA